jgi:tetratricopeptide (TPR) repeat protein
MALKPPPFPTVTRRGASASELALQNAGAAIQAGRPQEAERIAGDVLKTNAGDVRAMHILGTALVMQGRGKEAIAPLERAARASRDARSETELAVALRQAGRNEEARERLERAVKRKPPFPPAFLELGSVLSALNRHDEAIGILQQGVTIAPGFADLSLELGRAFAARGRNKEARTAFARAVAVAPAHADALFSLARACQAERDFAQAADSYRRILARAPKDAAVRIGLGVCLVELGRSEEALDHLRAASRTSAKMFGEAVAALVDAGRGRFWLRPSDAARALRGEEN